MPFGLGLGELLLIFLVLLLLFGAKRLPDLAKGLGKGIREFKKSVKDTTDELKDSMNDDETKKDPDTKS
jgi:sec-independent protein translocase protein TatA